MINYDQAKFLDVQNRWGNIWENMDGRKQMEDVVNKLKNDEYWENSQCFKDVQNFEHYNSWWDSRQENKYKDERKNVRREGFKFKVKRVIRNFFNLRKNNERENRREVSMWMWTWMWIWTWMWKMWKRFKLSLGKVQITAGHSRDSQVLEAVHFDVEGDKNSICY